MASLRTSALGRLGLVGFGLALFALLEMLLALAGLGGARDRGDPFLGFSGDYAIFVESDDGARLVTDRAKRDSFNEQSFAREKPAGSVRVFCLGGSATYGFPRGADAAFPALLERKLAIAFPQRQVEVINAGGLSYAAYRCVNVAREIARYEPDAIIYYGGNNEYVERRFFAQLRSEPPWRRSLRKRLNRLRSYTLLKKMLISPKPAAPGVEGGELFGVRVLREDNELLPRSDDEDRLIEESYEASLRQMIEIAREAGALFAIGVPAVNQSDWPPDLSIHDASLDDAALREFEARLAKGNHLREAGEPGAALAELEAAVRIDPRHAAARYSLGACYHALGETDKALAEYEAAIAHDAAPIRATPRLQQIARAVAQEEKVPLIDVARRLARLAPDGIVGRDFLLDYCHFTAEGHEIVADALFESLAATVLGAPGVEPPPLIGDDSPAGRSAFGVAWEGQMMARQQKWNEAQALFLEALALDPGFAFALEGMGRCFAARGDSVSALEYYERALSANPTNPTILTNLGSLYLSTGRTAEAVSVLERAVAVDPNSTNAHILHARALIGSGRTAEAVSALESAIAANPTRVEAHRWLARLRSESGDLAGAEASYREAQRLAPNDPALGYAHALVLVKLGRQDEALSLLEHAIERSPQFFQAIGAAGVIHMQQGRPARAAEMFRRVLELHPGDPLAERYLKALGAPAGAG